MAERNSGAGAAGAGGRHNRKRQQPQAGRAADGYRGGFQRERRNRQGEQRRVQRSEWSEPRGGKRSDDRRDRRRGESQEQRWAKPREASRSERRDDREQRGNREQHEPRQARGNRDSGKRFGDRDGGKRFGDRDRHDKRKDFGRGGTRGAGKSDRGGRERHYSEAERIAHELRPVRAAHTDPELPDEVLAKHLHPGARNELKTLEKDNADRVARHLAMAGEVIDFDPELAHQHAISAARRAGRIPVARETLAITAYALGDFAMALRELRTYRRLTGRDNHIALMVDCERGLGRPERGLEAALEADTSGLTTQERVHLAIAVSGARLDLGQLQNARAELEIPELDPHRAYPWSPELFAAYAAVLADLGDPEADRWEQLAERATAALAEQVGGDQLIVTDAMASDAELAARGIEIDNSAQEA